MQKTSCLGEFTKYTMLNVLGMIGLSCYILADTYFVALGLGADGLAALNLAIPVYSFIHGSGLMLGMGGATRYSILRSQQREEESNRAYVHMMAIGVMFAVVFLCLGIFASKQLAFLLGAEGAVFGMTETYLKVLLLFSPAFLLNDMTLCFVRNDNAPHLAMAAMLGGSISNIILDYVFIFPMKMGIFGAVFATGLAPIISLLILTPFFIRKKNHFHLRKCPVNIAMIRGIFAGGIPSLVTELSSGIVMIVFNMIILNLEGNTGVAAYGVVANISLVVIAVYTGIAQGVQPLFSRYYGMGEWKKISQNLKYAVITVITLSIAVYLVVFFGAGGIAGLFNHEGDPVLQKIAVGGMKIYFTGCLFAGLNIVMAIYFVATDYVKPANAISLLRGFLLILPLTFLMSAIWKMTGLWAAFPATEFLVTCVGLVMLKRRKKKNFM